MITLALAVAARRRARLVYVRARAGARDRAAGPVVTIAARRNLYGDAFNEAVLMRPGQWLTRRWSSSTTGRRRGGQRDRGRSAAARAGCAGSRPASCAPTRCPCSAAPCCSSPAAGGEVLDERLSLADRRGRHPAGGGGARRARAVAARGQRAWRRRGAVPACQGAGAGRLADHAGLGDRDGHQFNTVGAAVPADRAVLVDPASSACTSRSASTGSRSCWSAWPWCWCRS